MSFRVWRLRRKLNSTWSSETRYRAAEELGRVGGPKAVAVLADALRNSWDPPTRRHAATALARIGSPEAIAALAAALRDSSDQTRLSAAEQLGRIAGPQATAALMGALSGASSQLRGAVLGALSRRREACAVLHFLAALDDDDSAARGAALEGLVQVGRPAVEAIVAEVQKRRLEQQRWVFYENAIEALDRIGDSRAADTLYSMLEEKQYRAHCGVSLIAALARMGDSRVMAPLCEELSLSSSDQYGERQDCLLKAAGLLGDERVIPILLRSTQGRANGELKFRVLQVILDRRKQCIEEPVLRAVARMRDIVQTWHTPSTVDGNTGPGRRSFDCEPLRRVAREELERRGLAVQDLDEDKTPSTDLADIDVDRLVEEAVRRLRGSTQ